MAAGPARQAPLQALASPPSRGGNAALNQARTGLPADLAAQLEERAASEGVSAEALALSLLREAVSRHAPRPRVPLSDDGWGTGGDAEQVDELLADGFGQHG